MSWLDSRQIPPNQCHWSTSRPSQQASIFLSLDLNNTKNSKNSIQCWRPSSSKVWNITFEIGIWFEIGNLIHISVPLGKSAKTAWNLALEASRKFRFSPCQTVRDLLYLSFFIYKIGFSRPSRYCNQLKWEMLWRIHCTSCSTACWDGLVPSFNTLFELKGSCPWLNFSFNTVRWPTSRRVAIPWFILIMSSYIYLELQKVQDGGTEDFKIRIIGRQVLQSFCAPSPWP
jgi:hypothetical protein